MSVLCFDHADGGLCQLTVSTVPLARAIEAQLETVDSVWFEEGDMQLNREASELETPVDRPMFFEWQRLEWLFEPGSDCAFTPPLRLLVNGNVQKGIKSRILAGKVRLTGSMSLENSVGLTRFIIEDAQRKVLFSLGVEVFPQKLDYKDDFPAMLAEITEVLYALVFDSFTKTYAPTRPRATGRQLLSEWLNLFRVLVESLEQSLDTLLRVPKSDLRREQQVKPIHRVKRSTPMAIKAALRRPDRYCRGDGLTVVPGLALSHLQEQRKSVSYNTMENRFVVWALKDVLRQIGRTKRSLARQKGIQPARLATEIEELQRWERRFQRRLSGPVLREVSAFQNQVFSSTTLTMAAGYKEFYHRFLLLKRGLELAWHELFKMDFKDIATLYEYWCFLKTVKLLRENPRYDLVGNDIVKISHNRLVVNLKKGRRSAVRFVQRVSGDNVVLYFNRRFDSATYTHTFEQVPDQFIEFSRRGFGRYKDNKPFKVVMDAKYRFDRESEGYPSATVPCGPPLDSIAQLHRYRDAILWQQGTEDSVRLANKSIGGVILFPFPGDEQDFKMHPFYRSIEAVNIGAIPLQPGKHRQNALFMEYLEQLLELPGEVITEARVHYDNRDYRRLKQASKELVLVGLVPKVNREKRLDYHFGQRIFYTRLPGNGRFPLEKVRVVAMYDQFYKAIIGWGVVESVEVVLGKELKDTGITWAPTQPDELHIVYRLEEIHRVNLPAGEQMQGNRTGRYFISRLGLELALEERQPDLQFVNQWDQFIEWKTLKTRHSRVDVKRVHQDIDVDGRDVSRITFVPGKKWQSE